VKYIPTREWPKIEKDASRILNLFGPESVPYQKFAQSLLKTTAPILGCDLEYNEPERYVEVPTILGVSDGALHISVPFHDGLPYFKELLRRHPEMRFLGHAFTSADFFAFRQVGLTLKLENIEDTIIRHALVSAHLCKGVKSGEDDEGPSKGKGYMNLWTFLSLYTSLRNYKACIGMENGCDGSRPCRIHSEYAYNAVDSLGPVWGFPHILKSSIIRGVEKLYPLHRELAYVLGEMARYGVQADKKYLYGEDGESGLQGEFERQKAHIEGILPFNPKSNKAAIEHFKKKGIVLDDWQETTIREACEEYEDEELHLSLDHKELGAGVARWYAPVTKDKSGNWKGYMDAYGKIHPRLGMFTSTGRLQCIAKGTPIEVLRDVVKFPKGIPIEDVRVGDWAYTFDERKRLQLRRVLKTFCNGKREVVRVHWKAGGSKRKTGFVDVTPDHRIRLVDGSYKEAGLLQPGDRTLSLARGTSLGYARLWATGHREINREHRFVYRKLFNKRPQAVHHKDHNRLNNVPDNLEGKTHSQHMKDHAPGFAVKLHDIRSFHMKRRWKRERKSFLEVLRRNNCKLQLNRSKEWLEKELRAAKGSPVKVCRKHHFDYECFQKLLKRKRVSWKKIAEEFCGSERVDAKFIARHRRNFKRLGYIRAMKKLPMCYYRFRKIQERAGFVPYNHIITSVERLRGEVDVYDLEIDETHNFIAGEICAHNCVSPNLQNVSARRMDRHNCECGERIEKHPTLTCAKFKGISVGKLVRRGIIASPGHYLLESDFSNAENRCFLHQSGHSIPLDVDGHTQTSEMMGLTAEMEFVKLTGGGKTRQAAKSATHGSFYLEGIQLKLPREITGKVKKEIDIGAREIWPEWKFNGKIVTFTGSNLAQRAFGDKTYENRIKALEVLKRLFGAYPGARAFQRKIGEMIERQGAYVSPHGYYLTMLGEDEEKMKTAAAMAGSNPIAHLTKLALVDGWREMVKGRPMRPVLQVHDSILWEVRNDVEPKQAAWWANGLMSRETVEMPGMIIPTEHKASLVKISNWRDMSPII